MAGGDRFTLPLLTADQLVNSAQSRKFNASHGPIGIRAGACRSNEKTNRGRRISLDRNSLICPSCQNVAGVVVDRGRKSPAFSVHPVPARGACRPSRNVGRGERWARRVTRRVIWRARRSRVVLTPGLLASSSREANASRGRWWQEAPIHQGEHDISRKAIA
jgi:hypothetical protein